MDFNRPGVLVGSGNPGIQCERIQSAKSTQSCSAWASDDWPLGLGELEELGEFEPHAAIAAVAAIASARSGTCVGVLSMTQVVSGGGSHACNKPVDSTRTRLGGVMAL